MRRANYSYKVKPHPKELGGGEYILIRDLGPWDRHPTVTNDAENVIEDLRQRGILQNRRVLYYDSEDHLDELKHKDGRFAGFAPGPSRKEIPT